MPVVEGGTGASTLTASGVLLGQGTSAITATAVGTNGQLLIGTTASNPTFVTPTAGTGLSITTNATTLQYALSTPVTVSNGGTGNTTFTAYSVICAGTTATGAFQNVVGLGTSGQVLTSSGAGALPTWTTITTEGNIINFTSVNHASSPYTVLTTDYYLSCDVTAGTITLLLPNAPTAGSNWIVKDLAGLAGTNNITVTTVGGAVNIDGATSFVMNTSYQAIRVVFIGSAYQVF